LGSIGIYVLMSQRTTPTTTSVNIRLIMVYLLVSCVVGARGSLAFLPSCMTMMTVVATMNAISQSHQ
jgi:hypothetical protein